MEDATTISLFINAALSVLSIYLVKHMSKLRQIKNLAQKLLDVIDDHEVSPEEVEDIKFHLDELIYT